MKTREKIEGPWPYSVTKNDLEITWFNGSGCGGQNRNKNANCCRMKHKPTGTTTQAQEHKSREQNQRAAFKRLAAKLVPLMRGLIVTQPEVTRSNEVIRTYKEKPNLVIDSRLNQRYNLATVLDGKLSDLHEELKSK